MQPAHRALVAALCAAATLPTLLALNEPPSPTALNQAAAIGAWGMVVGIVALARRRTAPLLHRSLRESWTPVAALALIATAAGLSGLLGHLPAALSLSALGMTVVTAGVVLAGVAAPSSTAVRLGFMVAMAAAGICSLLVGMLQVFAPSLADGDWVARSGVAGRAVGNLRQPNHLSTLLLWSAVSVLPMFEAANRRARAVLAAVYAGLLFGVVLSGSRTGLVGVAVLALWGSADSRLSAPARRLLVAAPLLCLGAWLLLDWWAATHHIAALGTATRVGESDASGGRFAIWRDTLALIAQNPWLGVGFGEFNFAWTLTPFPQRHTAFFDHTHNLPLQLAVELGIPLALLVLSLLAWGLWQAFDRSRRVEGPDGVALRTAFVMVLLMALHSQLEYPLWYAYFLLPTAFAWGLCLGAGTSGKPALPSSGHWIRMAGIALLVGAAAMLWDYRRVVVIFAPGENAAPLAERIAEGRRSWFFAHHADYALVTTAEEPVTLPGAFDRAPHYLLDTRLMIAWAQSLAARGDVDRARYLAARLREFRNPGSKAFFAPCDDPQVADKPFQCRPPERVYDWRDFRR